MRKKRSSPFEGKPDSMLDLDIELEKSDDEDDVIDLEDIIEMPDSPIDEDQDLDLGIFDEDSDLQPEPEKPAPSPMERRPLGFEEEDLLESFGDETEEDETLFEPAAPGKIPTETADHNLFDEDEESLLDEFMEQHAVTEAELRAEEKVDLKARTLAALQVPEETPQIEPEAAIWDESFAPEPSEAAVQTSTPAPPVDLSQTAEELIGLIEERLQEYIRVAVESRLPDLVRSIITEEIEKIKEELKN